MAGEAKQKETKPKIRILLADDQYIVRQGIRHILHGQRDFQVVGEADNGEQAARLARELKPNIIIIDEHISKLDSAEATKRIKSHDPNATVLVLTTYSDRISAVNILRAGATGYLLKSTGHQQLIQAIRLIRNGMLVVDPTLEQEILTQAARPQPAPLDHSQYLTSREIEVLDLLVKGYSNRQIANFIGLSERTVKGYVTSIFNKMGVNSRSEAVREALRRGWASLDDK